MTCVIGMFFEFDKKALLVADSRTSVGGDYLREQKVFQVAGEDIVFAGSGYSGMTSKLIERIEAIPKRSGFSSSSDITNAFEDEMANIYDRYKASRPSRFSDADTLLIGILGLIDSGRPRLQCLYENGYAEEIRQFHAVGHGARHARNILRSLYEPSLSEDAALEIAVHALSEVAKIDATVDDYPQVAILTDTVKILNKIDQQFRYECEKFEAMKQKLSSLEKKRTRLFHVLLNGSSEAKAKLDAIILEYGKKPIADSIESNRGRLKGIAES
jgi:20S proteasome alpha/beta subunit